MFVELFQIKDKFHCQESLLREHNKRKIQFSFSKVFASAYESVHLRECANTEFDWGVKWGFEKASVSRAVHL